jgi:hypothetical protein
MTRKDYRLIAEAIRYTAEGIDTDDEGAHQALVNVASNLSVELRRDNPRFDRTKFFAACSL